MDDDWILPGGLICQPLHDPLLCPAEEKSQRETDNTVAQLDFIELLVARSVGDGDPFQLRPSHVQELQRIAVDGIYGCAGEYRTATHSAKLTGGGVTHKIPDPARVPDLVREALDRANGSEGVTVRAAYVLWRFNWIHPFRGGNGRTARALAYLLFCAEFGRLLPGEPSFPTIMSERRDRYVIALREADGADLDGREDFGAMTRLVRECMLLQLDSVLSK